MNATTEYTPGQYAILTYPLHGPNAERLSLGVGGEIVAPGLAITPDIGADENGNVGYNGGFMLTLISTGHNLNGSNLGGQCISCVRHYAQAAVASGIDWTKPQPEISALLKTEGDEFKAMRKAQEHLLCCEGYDCHDDGF